MILLFTWGIFLVAAGVAFILEIRAERQEISLRAFLTFSFPGEGWKSHSARTDVLLYLLAKITDRTIDLGVLLLTGLLSYYVSHCLVAYGFAPRSTKGGVLAAISLGLIFFLVTDLANYLTHLAEHKLPFLWEFHKVHHTATFLSPLTETREHPLVKLFEGFASALFLCVLVGVAKTYYSYSMIELMGMLATANTVVALAVLDPLRHSQFPVSLGWFDRLFISPHMHQLHHSVKEAHWNKNMGNKLAIWDGLFRTMFIPVRGEALQYGSGSAADDHEYRSVLRCYVVPFVNNYRTWKSTFGNRPHPVLDRKKPEIVVEEQGQISRVA